MPRLRKLAEVQYVFDSEDESDYETQARKRKGKRRIRKDDDYDPGEGSDHSTKKEPKRNLTEYEIMVQKNRDEKLAFLKSLNFDEVTKGLSDTIKNLKEKRKNQKRPKPTGPPRKSQRLAGEEIDLFELDDIVAINEAKPIQTEKKQLPTNLTFEKAVLQEAKYSYEDFKEKFGDLDYGSADPFNEHVSHFEKKELPESQIYDILPSKITSLSLHPMKDNILVAAAGFDGHIGFLNVNSGDESFVFEPHTQAITHLQFNPEHPRLIVSSSRDGTVRCGDLEKAVFNEVYNISDEYEGSCTYFDFLSHCTLLVAQKNGIVSVVDIREEPAVPKKYQLYDPLMKKHKELRTVSVHPLKKNYFISAGTCGGIKLWDLRKVQNQPITEKQQQRFNNAALFSPLTGKYVLSTGSQWHSICMINTASLGESLLLPPTSSHNNHSTSLPNTDDAFLRRRSGRIIEPYTKFKRQIHTIWLPNTDDAFAMGNGSSIEVYNSKMDNIFTFTDKNLTGTTYYKYVFHPSLPVLATTNGQNRWYYGKICLFQ